MKLPEKNAGFTLIEVTIALVILGISLIALAGLMGSTTRNNATGGHLTEAATLAQDMLERLRMVPLSTLNNTFNPDTPQVDNPPVSSTGITYTRTWSYHPNFVPNTTLDTVTITVSWVDPAKKQPFSITMTSSIPL